MRCRGRSAASGHGSEVTVETRDVKVCELGLRCLLPAEHFRHPVEAETTKAILPKTPGVDQAPADPVRLASELVDRVGGEQGGKPQLPHSLSYTLSRVNPSAAWTRKRGSARTRRRRSPRSSPGAASSFGTARTYAPSSSGLIGQASEADATRRI